MAWCVCEKVHGSKYGVDRRIGSLYKMKGGGVYKLYVKHSLIEYTTKCGSLFSHSCVACLLTGLRGFWQ